VLGGVALAGSLSTSSLLDFVTFDGIDYIRFADEPGRELTRDDLGIEFATVACSIGEDNRGCSYGLDGGAAFLPAGTRMYAVRGFATEVLRSSGYQVMEASSGDEATRLFNGRDEPIHLLLTDVVLRGMNGRELAEIFVQAFPASSVLFTSGYPDDVTARKGVPRGSVAFLPKPYSPEALTARVAELLNSATV
jgi:CheY-like chemotaxis protein